MLIATFSAAASFSHVSAIRSAVARLIVVKSWICSAALPLTTNCDGTFCADSDVPSATAAAAIAIAVMRTFMCDSSLPAAALCYRSALRASWKPRRDAGSRRNALYDARSAGRPSHAALPGVYKVSREAVTSRLPALLDHGAWLRGPRCTAPTHGATPRRGRRRRRIRRVDGPVPATRGRRGHAARRVGTGQQPGELRRGDTRHPHDLRAHTQVRGDGGTRDGALAQVGSHRP